MVNIDSSNIVRNAFSEIKQTKHYIFNSKVLITSTSLNSQNF